MRKKTIDATVVDISETRTAPRSGRPYRVVTLRANDGTELKWAVVLDLLWIRKRVRASSRGRRIRVDVNYDGYIIPAGQPPAPRGRVVVARALRRLACMLDP